MECRERLARMTFLLTEVGESNLQERSRRGMREEFKALSMNGLPENSSIRPATYRHLLNLQPAAILSAQYTAFVDELGSRLSALTVPSPIISEELPQDKLLKEIERDVVRTFGDLGWFSAEEDFSRGEEDVEDPFWRRIEMLEQVEEERARNLADATPTPSSKSTFPSTSNPNSPSPPALSLLLPSESKDQQGTVSFPPTPTTPKGNTPDQFSQQQTTKSRPYSRRQSLLRPLYIYATLNPGISYVQGMNSIIAVLYWIFSTNSTSPLEAEASAFFALGAILSQIRDLFVKSLDGSMIPTSPRSATMSPSSSQNSVILNTTPAGLGATLTRYTSLLSWLDPDVANSLAVKQVDPSLYIFRWLTTLFANDFALPDLVRVWDRIVSLFPAQFESDAQEALSPVLGHLLDLSLGIVLMIRPVIVSPNATFSRIISTLQSPQIEGASVDRLLFIAWDIRERRLGKYRRPSSISSASGSGGGSVGDWKSRLGAAVTATAAGPTATSLKARWFGSGSSSPEKKEERRFSQHASEYDLDDSISQADSDTSTSSVPMLFASRGQTIGSGGENNRRISMTNTLGLEQVDGRFLPPPPQVMDHREKFGEMNLPPPPSIDEVDEEQFSSDDENVGAAFRAKVASSWGGWKNSIARLASSDTAASISKTTTNLSLAASLQAASISQSASQLTSSDAAASLSKATTNLTIQAQMLRDRVAEETPERLARIKENVTAASGRFMAPTGSEAGTGGPRRPGSPVIEPFTPPRWGDSPGMGRRPVSPAPFGTGDSFTLSGGPKPLILSSAARRASSADGSQETLSPPASKRNSIGWMRSPSPSPANTFKDLPTHSTPSSNSNTLPSHPNFPEPSSINSNSRVQASSFRSPSTAPTPLGLKALEDHPVFPEPLVVAGDGSPKVRRVLPRRQEIEEDGRSSSSSSPSAVPSAGGRGWSLSDAPTPILTPSRSTELDIVNKESASLTSASIRPSPALPPLPFTSPLTTRSPSSFSAHEDLSETHITRSNNSSQRSSRRSVQLEDTVLKTSSSPTSDHKPTRQSSSASTESQVRADAPQRSKVLRKAPARKRTSRQAESMGDIPGLTSSNSGRVPSVEEGSIREVKSDRDGQLSDNGNEVEDILDSYS